MKNQLFMIILVLSFLSCRNETNKKNIVKAELYPFSQKFDQNGYLSYNSKTDILFLKFHYSNNHLNETHFLILKKDTILIDTLKIKTLPFYKSFLKFKNQFISLNTKPRTLGKNLKSTDILTKYDENSRIVLKKDMDISKFPNGNCFIIGNNHRLFYISDWFAAANSKRAAESKLIISEIDTSFNILNQKLFKNKNSEFDYNPAKCIFIENTGIVIVSYMSYFEIKDLPFRIEMFDLDLNKKWSENFEANSLVSLGYSKNEKKIFLISEKEETKINFWDYDGNKQKTDYTLDTNLISSTSNCRLPHFVGFPILGHLKIRQIIII